MIWPEMKYATILSPEAIEDLRRLKAPIRSQVKEGNEIHLRHEPLKESNSRIKRLRGMRRPGYQLRIGEIRVFYDVSQELSKFKPSFQSRKPAPTASFN